MKRHELLHVAPQSWKCSCGVSISSPKFRTQDEAIQSWAGHVNRAKATSLIETPPECTEHKEVQHRDRKRPWCDACGWNHGSVTPAQKLGEPR